MRKTVCDGCRKDVSPEEESQIGRFEVGGEMIDLCRNCSRYAIELKREMVALSNRKREELDREEKELIDNFFGRLRDAGSLAAQEVDARA